MRGWGMVYHGLRRVVELRTHGPRGSRVIEENPGLVVVDIRHGVRVQGLGWEAGIEVGTRRSGKGRGWRVQGFGGLTIGIV